MADVEAKWIPAKSSFEVRFGRVQVTALLRRGHSCIRRIRRFARGAALRNIPATQQDNATESYYARKNTLLKKDWKTNTNTVNYLIIYHSKCNNKGKVRWKGGWG